MIPSTADVFVNGMKTNKKIVISIIILIALGCAAFAGVVYVKYAENKAAELAEQQALEQQRLEAEKAAKAKAEAEKREYELADHVYSHRGSNEEIEETFAAYDKAIEQGSHNIEQDLVISADGTLYISHDLTSYRIAGGGGYFSSMSDAQIDKLTTSDGQKILKLSDVFDKYGKSVKYIIEIKSKDQRTIEAFKKIVDKYDMKDNVVVQCFELSVLKELEDYYPDMPKLHLSLDQGSFENALTKDYVDILGVESSMMTTSNLERAHANGKKFNAWPLDSESQIKTAIEMGVDSYFTGYTGKALELEHEYRNEGNNESE